jgi:Na+/citrate or Na+/malate symporter
VSDSTGNTRLHRELLVDEIPTMFNLPDIVHFISNVIKDIVKITYFKNTITVMRGVIAKFHKSHLGATELEFTRVECGIGQGLTTIGKTRFGTLILAAWALQLNLLALKRVVERNNFDLGVRYFLKIA